MTELESAILAVKENQYSFCKFISANDAGATGAHQAGLYIPKNSTKLLFDEPGDIGTNKEKFAWINWYDGSKSNCRFIYYGQGTRNEYRVTRLGKKFVEGEFIIIVKNIDDNYLGYLLSSSDAEQFLKLLGIHQEDTNKLIEKPTSSEGEIFKLNISQNIENDLKVQSRQINFRPKAHILILLGEELIKNPVMAIYELIKNSYDADARVIEVTFENIEAIDDASIVVKDNGTGISSDVLENVWFEPGTDFRKPLNEKGIRQIKRSPIYHRIPMGEKGVGRFAVHKLGNKISLTSRPAEIIKDDLGQVISVELLNYEVTLNVDWRKFSQGHYLDDVGITWSKNYNQDSFNFKNSHGTLIEVSSLKEEWTRGMARQLKRQTLSMLSPKNDPSKFRIDLNFRNWWLNDIPETSDLLDQAPYKLTVFVDSQYNMSFEYDFRLANNPQMGFRTINSNASDGIDRLKSEYNIKGALKPFFREYLIQKEYEASVIENIIIEFDEAELPYGNLLIELYSYDLDSYSLKDITNNPRIIREFLRDQSGIRVFKGDLRVYDYGDPGNDWLGLDLKRVQNKEWFSNNQNIGYIYLDPETSGSLIEKTNREGFIHNPAYENFTVVLDYILTQFKVERQSDRNKWLKFNKKEKGQNSFEDKISGFREIIEATALDDEGKQKLLGEADRIEEKYEEDRNNLLIPAGVGMTASFAMHEIEKLVPRMQETVSESVVNKPRIIAQVDELKDYVGGILSVLKKGGNKPILLLDSISQAVANYNSRLVRRKINVEVNDNPQVQFINCDRRLLVTILMNLIDNSVYWLDTIFKDLKGIYIGTYIEEKGISILIVDNGPGFKERPDDIIRPFYTRKQNGIGIGMYLVDTIMIQYGRLNIIYDKEYLAKKGVPDFYDGAAVELIFNKLQ